MPFATMSFCDALQSHKSLYTYIHTNIHMVLRRKLIMKQIMYWVEVSHVVLIFVTINSHSKPVILDSCYWLQEHVKTRQRMGGGGGGDCITSNWPASRAWQSHATDRWLPAQISWHGSLVSIVRGCQSPRPKIVLGRPGYGGTHHHAPPQVQ